MVTRRKLAIGVILVSIAVFTTMLFYCMYYSLTSDYIREKPRKMFVVENERLFDNSSYLIMKDSLGRTVNHYSPYMFNEDNNHSIVINLSERQICRTYDKDVKYIIYPFLTGFVFAIGVAVCSILLNEVRFKLV